jgi:hypothetical protein
MGEVGHPVRLLQKIPVSIAKAYKPKSWPKTGITGLELGKKPQLMGIFHFFRSLGGFFLWPLWQ